MAVALDKRSNCTQSYWSCRVQQGTTFFDAYRGAEDIDVAIGQRFRAMAARAELIASQSTSGAIRRAIGLMHEDAHAVEARIERKTNPAWQSHHGRAHTFSDFYQWHDVRDAMHNAFRRDVGLPALTLEHVLVPYEDEPTTARRTPAATPTRDESR